MGPAAELHLSLQLRMIDLNIRVLTDLSLRFIDSLERHRGGILNVASVLAFLPGPEMAVYHATKSYVLSFSEALHEELRAKGIRVTALCPGPVDTEFQVRVGGYLARRLIRSAERVAHEGYEGTHEPTACSAPRHGELDFFLASAPPSQERFVRTVNIQPT